MFSDDDYFDQLEDMNDAIALQTFDASKFFISPKAFLVFTLVYTDGKVRQRLLRITSLLYSNKNLATQWFNEIKHHLSDTQYIADTDKALGILEDIYQCMIDD